MHQAAYRFVSQMVIGIHYGSVVEIGGRDINGGVRHLVTADDYISIDLEEGPAVDVVGDCRTWTPPWSADLVICCEVLEHADDPAAVVKACRSYLASGGQLVLTCAGPGRPSHSGHDGGQLQPGEHYANIHPDWLREQLEDLNDVHVEYDPTVNDVYATATQP